MNFSPIIGASSWALHSELGAPPIFGVEAGATIPRFAPSNARFSLLEMPDFLAQNGFDTMQICHFHLPWRDESYLADLCAAIENSGVSLHALLVDEGDLTHPQFGARDEKWIGDWLPVAAQLGARTLRVIAGKTNGQDALERSASALLRLCERAEKWGVQIQTENWFALLNSPDAVDELLARCENRVGFLLDFSNWSDAQHLQNLARIAPHAAATHAQAKFLGPAQIDGTEFAACLNLPYARDFRGPFVFVNGGADGILTLRDFVRAHFDC